MKQFNFRPFRTFNYTLLSWALSLFVFDATGQSDISIGAWRHHLPNNTVVSLAETPGKIYAATPYGLLEYDKEYNSIKKFDKISGLSGFGINVIHYVEEMDLLIMGYQNGTIDVKSGNQFFSLPDIRQANILGSKSINNIFVEGNRAWLACDFGIVVLDLNEFVITDTWFIGPDGSMLNVYDIIKTGNTFFAASEAGLLKAPEDAPNLADFQYWQQVEELPHPWGTYNIVTRHNNVLLANFSTEESDTIYAYDGDTWEVFNPIGDNSFYQEKTNIRSMNDFLVVTSYREVQVFDENLTLVTDISYVSDLTLRAWDAIVDADNILWLADGRSGLVKAGLQGNYESIILRGPPNEMSFGLAHNQSTLWVAPGAIIGGWQNTWNDRGVYLYDGKQWDQFSRNEFPQLSPVRDIHQITPHHQNKNRVFASAWRGGIVEFDMHDGLIEIYNEENSTLQIRTGAEDFVRVGGSDWDSRGNLWVSNSDAEHFISVKKPNGDWMSYPHNGFVSGNETLGHVVVDNADQKWVAMPRGGGILVFKEETTDHNEVFDIRKLTTQEGNGSLPSTRVTTLAKDMDGYIWVATNEGVVVFYSPHLALRGDAFNAQTIIVEQDGFAGRLFENDMVNTIFVDGSNKKWFGTRSSGAFLLSPDGRETISHFNTDNSPLPSNNILDISVDPQTGEVFFATDQGLAAYRGYATEGERQHTDVYAYPNPVRPGYSGYIAVKGLVSNARVKITDINGNLVHDGYAEGGQMVWDGKNLSGKKPGTGVYLVFSTDPQGEETMVTKILFIR